MKHMKLGKANMGFLDSNKNEYVCLLSYMKIRNEDDPNSIEELDITKNGVIITIDLKKMVITKRQERGDKTK